MTGARALLVLASLAAAAPAAAQSRRYPPEPVDADREAELRSALWERATNPTLAPYQELVREARAALGERTSAHAQHAVEKLDAAVALVPDRAEAYALRGEAHLLLQAWHRCAQDLELAARHAPPPATAAQRRVTADQRRTRALCLARAGKLAAAERALTEGTLGGDGNGEMLMRLGEIRIAMGKLEEAIAALTAALEATDVPSQALTRWLLAAAYDRARRPADAIAQARLAAGLDRTFAALTGNTIPLLGAGETTYLLGLAWALSRVDSEPPRPEHALVHFRSFLAIAPDSPWRRRAEEHVRELASATLPEAIERRGGTAALDLDAARAIVRRAMPALRACLARLPTTLVEVTITRAGPRTARPPAPSPRHDPYRRPRYPYYPPAPPPEGVSVGVVANLVEVGERADVDAALRCVEPLAERIVLPPTSEKDAWYKVGFFVVGP